MVGGGWRIRQCAGDDQVSTVRKKRSMDCHTRCSAEGHRKFGFSLDHSNLEFVWGQRLVLQVEESESAGIRRQLNDILTHDTRRCRIREVRKRYTLCLVNGLFNVTIDWRGRTVSGQGPKLKPCTQSRMTRLLTIHCKEHTTHNATTIMEPRHQNARDGDIRSKQGMATNCEQYTTSDTHAGHVFLQDL